MIRRAVSSVVYFTALVAVSTVWAVMWAGMVAFVLHLLHC